jgi:ubiquinone/menaquinone biosynthesis C-methylase UbiE
MAQTIWNITFSSEYEARVNAVIGLDPSLRMLEKAREKKSVLGISDEYIRFIHDRVENLSELFGQDECFDDTCGTENTFTKITYVSPILLRH